MQHRTQWQNELIACTKKYGEEKRSVRMIALGGIHTTLYDELSYEWHSQSDEADANSVDSLHRTR